MDAHELYFYSSLVQSWDFPKDTLSIKNEISNLHYSLSIYSGLDKSLIWSYPRVVDPSGYMVFADSDDLGLLHDISIPLFSSYGASNKEENLTMVIDGDLAYFFSIDQDYSSEYINYIPPMTLLLLFMFGLNYFIQYTLRPIKLMKRRMHSLKDGDLSGEVPIIGNDELAELSIEINTMIAEIKSLLYQKEQLLLDVSHEMRSPLARMRLLIDMIPNHKNQQKLIDEIVFLDGMISNLLLSDKLSIPYSNLNYEVIKSQHLIIKVLDLVGDGADKIIVKNNFPDFTIRLDETKMIIALRNILDNALKYSDRKEKINMNVNTVNNNIIFEIKSIGQEISQDEKDAIFKPFFRSSKNKANSSGFGLGLTICKKIVSAHRGKMKVDINGKETSFIVVIPKDVKEKKNDIKK